MSNNDEAEIVQEPNNIIPLFGRDEMNLVEFPLGPISPQTVKTFEIDHVVRDKKTNREITRRLLVTGSEAFGLPRPTDEQVLVGMKALTQEAGFQDRRVFFSRYHLARTIGWQPDGRSYQRLENSLDRLAGTTFKFKNAWWDKGESVWRSNTFHLIDNVELCSRDRYDKAMAETGRKQHALCHFVWNEVIWKSFQDGFIKSIDMEMFRRIANGKRREVPLRLYRWLDKQFYRKDTVTICVAKLSEGTLGLAGKYPSEFVRVVTRAARVLVDVGYLGGFEFKAGKKHSGTDAVFRKRTPKKKSAMNRKIVDYADSTDRRNHEPDQCSIWINSTSEQELLELETSALNSGYGSSFQREAVLKERNGNRPVRQSRLIRQDFIWGYQKRIASMPKQLAS